MTRYLVLDVNNDTVADYDTKQEAQDYADRGEVGLHVVPDTVELDREVVERLLDAADLHLYCCEGLARIVMARLRKVRKGG